MSGKRLNTFLLIQHSHIVDDLDIDIRYHRLTGRVVVKVNQQKVLSRLTWLSPFINHTFHINSIRYRLRIISLITWSATLFRDAECCINELLPARRKRVLVRWTSGSILFLTRLLAKVL
ncbi:hypothetical protein HHX48_13390 [Salinimonas sp. HHU 13199]|uniref:Tyr recombinase domain-containing protein n=1 Tax=Salinimonas profundi TaxID=2729140 RepID=A0ABR8LP88_9ALTE|nr:hypothetical protein [Salinimonas profundi]MBD3586736.1 hypothetical protein [Salinimonas profundi]